MVSRPPIYPVVLSILAAVVTIGMKGIAWWITGSVGLLSDAAESLVNLAAAGTALFSLWYSSRPADPSHTYGHEKIEYFSSGLEGSLILVAAGGIAGMAIWKLFDAKPLEDLGVGGAIGLAASGINLVVAQILLRVARRTGSIVLEADGKHLMTDVWTSVGVLAGLGLVWATGFQWLDSVVALLVAANITWTAFDLVRRSFNGLMDHALPPEEIAQVRAAIESQLGPDMTYHALRTRQAGNRRFADFHLLVPGDFSVRLAHSLGERIEAAIKAALLGIEVTVHIEPIEEPGSWKDSALLGIEDQTRSTPHQSPKR